jgi:predicted patatin/cPLA2 family phospholipase
MYQANYGAKQPNNTAYIKTFNNGNLDDLWYPSVRLLDNVKVDILTPTAQKDIYIPRNIYIGGSIIYTSPLSYSQTTATNDTNTTIVSNTNDTNNTITNSSSSYLEIDSNIISKLNHLEAQIQNLEMEINKIKQNIYL